MTDRRKRRTPSHPMLVGALGGACSPSDARPNDTIEHVRELCLSLYHLAPVGYLTHDVEGRILEANYTVGSMLGVPSHRLRGAFLASFVPDDAEGALGTHLARVAATEARVIVELRMQRPAGTCFHASLETAPFEAATDGGDGLRFLTAVVDITDRKRLEATLLEREAALQAIFATAADGLIGVDENGVIRSFGTAAERMFGYSSREAVGRHVDVLFEAAAPRRESKACSTTGEAFVQRARCRRRDGRTFEAEVSVGGPTCGGSTIFVVRDASGSRETGAEYGHLLELAGRTAASIVHDTNNLLMRVVSATQALADVADDPEAVRRRAEELRRMTLGGAAVIRRVSSISTPGTRRERTSDIDAALTEMSGLIDALLSEAIELSVCLGAGSARVPCERGEIEQLVLNLVGNAGDALPKGGRVEITTCRVERDGREHVRLLVCDDGIGMTEDVRLRALSRGFTTKPHGSGLGLDTVRGIVERARGRLRIESRPGAGTAFTIDLPAVEPTEQDRRPMVGDAKPSALLVVEDDPLNRRMLGTLLERRGYSVQLAATVREAIHQYRTAPRAIDVVLSDARLPDGSVAHLVNTLRCGESAPPVLVISGLDASIDPEIVTVLSLPRTAFMQKPAGIDELVREIEDLRAGS